ncbi:hypothetical protein ABGB17_08055 [Sphaerisporangium sp. B11E5]|uniref:hypothetical protein n=1 Tax=Sphaerisporangium sp. B11E5 TaxID=3153563 RepID=UPI00325F6CC3
MGRPAAEVVREHWPQIFGFVLSFVVMTPDAVVAENPIPPRVVRAAFTATALLVLAFVLAVTLPGVGYHALLVRLLTGPLTRWWGRIAARSHG